MMLPFDLNLMMTNDRRELIDKAEAARQPKKSTDIVEGKLYAFLNAVAFGKYKEDKAGTLAKAEKNWPAMHHVDVEEVNGGV